MYNISRWQPGKGEKAMYIKAIVIALAIGTFFVQPTFAGGADETKLLYEEIVGQPGRLGDEFALRYKGKKESAGDILFNRIFPSLPDGTVFCAATQNEKGANFLVYTSQPSTKTHTTYFHFLLDGSGKWKGAAVPNQEEAAKVWDEIYVGAQYLLFTTLPSSLLGNNGIMHPQEAFEALGPTRAYLERLGKKKTLARSR